MWNKLRTDRKNNEMKKDTRLISCIMRKENKKNKKFA